MDIPASPAAKAIHARFLRKMAPGGEIDQILAGGPGAPKQPALSDEEIERIKKNIDVQIVEYGQAMGAAVTWFAGWKSRNLRGFRAQRRSRS